MKLETKINCIVCKTALENLEYEQRNGRKIEVHPMLGLHFTSSGHYGSTIFDPISSEEQLDVAICDRCIMKNLDSVRGTGKQSIELFKDLFD
jgi:hypothetical protein